MMERELAVPWEDVFSDIDPEPLAAGTIAQVHRARMADRASRGGQSPAPEAEQVVETDLALLEMIVGQAGRSRQLNRIIDLPSLAEQVSRALRDELDFGEEARNIVRMDERQLHYIPSRDLVARSPTPAPCHGRGRRGVPLLEAPKGPRAPRRPAGSMQAYYKQVLDGFYADPHPGACSGPTAVATRPRHGRPARHRRTSVRHDARLRRQCRPAHRRLARPQRGRRRLRRRPRDLPR